MNSNVSWDGGQFIASVITGIGAIWAITRYILQPAYKIAQSEERARQYQLTTEAYKARIDEMLVNIDRLRLQVEEQTKRSDMLLVYISDRFAWERGGSEGKPPPLPIEFETLIYNIVDARVKREDELGRG